MVRGSCVVEHVTRRGAVFDERELRCVALERAASTGLSPDAALAGLADLRERREVLELAGGLLTTARMRALESELEDRVAALAHSPGRAISPAARATVIEMGAAPLEGRPQVVCGRALSA